jgi:hypothetical protein
VAPAQDARCDSSDFSTAGRRHRSSDWRLSFQQWSKRRPKARSQQDEVPLSEAIEVAIEVPPRI